MKRFALLLLLAGCGPKTPEEAFAARLDEAESVGKDSVDAERDLVEVRSRRDLRGPIPDEEQKRLNEQETAVKRRRATTYQREQDVLRRLAEDLDDAIAKAPDNLDFLLLRMRARDGIDRSEQGSAPWVDPGPQNLSDAAKVLEKRPGDPTALALKAGALRKRGDYEKARAAAAEALRKDGRHARALAEEGLNAYALNDFDAADRALDAANEQIGRLPAHVRLEVIERTIEKAERRAKWEKELQDRARDASANVPRVRLSTSKGDIVLELFEDDAPNTVAYFVYLVESATYDGLTFHMVVPDQLIQAGDQTTRPGSRRGIRDTTPSIDIEPSKRRHFRGSIALAQKRGRTTSEFYILRKPMPNYDGKFAVFGRVIEGWDVLDSITQGDVLGGALVVSKRDHPYRPEFKK